MLSEYDKTELRDFLREAVVAGLKAHPCRFDDEQAKVLHQMADKFTPDQLTTLNLWARSINGAAARIGQVLVWGHIVAIVAGIVILAKMGFIPDP